MLDNVSEAVTTQKGSPSPGLGKKTDKAALQHMFAIGIFLLKNLLQGPLRDRFLFVFVFSFLKNIFLMQNKLFVSFLRKTTKG